MAGAIDQLIVNGPYDEPTQHWTYDRESRTFSLVPGRRAAGYVVATPGSKSFDDPGVFRPLPLVNKIRPRVKAWREAGYPGVAGTTLRLLQHWRDPELFEERRFFFCQLEAVETLIWLAEAPAGERQGIEIPGDGGAFTRLCAKMATGSGKTLVMAMVIAWHILNRVASPQDSRFSKHVLVVAPGLTVRKRLAVLEPADPGSYYDRFNMVPSALRERLRQGRVLVRNWHTLNWESDEQIARRRSVDRRGAMSDAAYVKEVLGEMASASNLLVVNDEAHHAWRVPAGSKVRGVSKSEIEEAIRWIGGLDRIHRSRGILGAYDFSATPFAPSGRESSEEALFGWTVSDFSLNDAIESGLVKTPRVVVRGGARAAPHGLRAGSGHRTLPAGARQHLRHSLHVPAPRGGRRRRAGSAAAQVADRGAARAARSRDLLAERAPRRAHLGAPPLARLGEGGAAAARRLGDGDTRRAGPGGGGQARRQPRLRDRSRRSRAALPAADARFQGGARGVRPDDPDLVWRARGAHRPAGAADRGIPRLAPTGHLAGAVRGGRAPAPNTIDAQHEPDRPPPLGGDSPRERAGPDAGVRHRAAHPRHRRHAALVHGSHGHRPSAPTSIAACSTARGRPARPFTSTAIPTSRPG